MDIHAFKKISNSKGFQKDCEIYASKIKNDLELKEKFDLLNLDLYKTDLKGFHENILKALEFIEVRKNTSKLRRAKKKKTFDFIYEDENCLVTATDDPKFSRAAGSLLKGADSCPWCTATEKPEKHWGKYGVLVAAYIYSKKDSQLKDAWAVIFDISDYYHVARAQTRGISSFKEIENLKNNVGTGNSAKSRVFKKMLKDTELTEQKFDSIFRNYFRGFQQFKDDRPLNLGFRMRSTDSVLENVLNHTPSSYAFDAINKELLRASAANNYERVKFCIEHGADVRARDVVIKATALHNAAYSNAFEIAEYLLKHDADVNALSRSKSTPLDFCCGVVHASKETLKVLLEYGADPNLTKPLLNAATSYDEEIVEILLKYGADVNAENDEGENSLHIALDYGKLENAKILIKNGIDVNRRDTRGESPIFIAVKCRNMEGLEILLKGGAKTDVENEDGKSPLDIAREKNFKNIENLILKSCKQSIVRK